MGTPHNCLFWLALGLMLAVSRVSASEPAPPPDDPIDWVKEKQFWSFRTPQPQARPKVKNLRWPKQTIDYFILARLESKNIAPSHEADRRTLARRLSLDLTGLPPAAADVEAFVADRRPDAYDRLVDRLIQSPAFGERMASLWLPLARYAEDQAHQVGKDTKFFYPNAYKYREWVINAFNSDLPYDKFIHFQLAADQLAAEPEHLPALGFIGLGPKYYNRNRLEVMADEWEDRVDTVSRTMLGLTVACARCHDHKFEPITQRDYYGLASVFASTRMVNKKPDGKEETKDASAEKMDPATVHMIEDGDIKDLNVFIRGNVDRKGAEAPRSFLRILSKEEPVRFEDGSGRKELALAIGTAENPLTARVIVNRLWAAFFGQPLVPTPSNFGHSGDAPTYPDLLDDLATRFVESGWSVKQLIREFVTSSTYRQTSLTDSARDPANDLLGRMTRRRLSVEQWRDSVLAVSGELEYEGGKSLELDDTANLRRTVYGRVSRLKLNDLLMQFDYPDANVHAEKRSVTTSPSQKLFMLNSPFILARAKAFSDRLAASADTDAGRIHNAYRILFSREPDRDELSVALAYLNKPASGDISRWDRYAQMLLVSNEMLYVD
jgi:hypothetical protein